MGCGGIGASFHVTANIDSKYIVSSIYQKKQTEQFRILSEFFLLAFISVFACSEKSVFTLRCYRENLEIEITKIIL